MRDFIGTGLSDSAQNCNVMNILRVLVDDKDCTAYIPYDYVSEKEGKSRDPRVHFPPKSSGRPMQIIDIQGHQERFNFSVRCLVDVSVEFESDDTKVLKPMKVWRSYTVIRDGKLQINKICAKLSKSAYDDLLKVDGILYIGDKKIDSSYTFDNDIVYTLSLSGLPLLSSNWARPNVLSFHKMLQESERLSDKIKQYKKILKESNKSTISEDSNSNVYTESISDHGSYKGDTEVNCVTYTIKEKPGYKPPKYTDATVEEFKKLNSTLNDYRFKCACIKWAMESAKSHRKSSYNWSELYQKKSGSSKYYQETTVDIDGETYLLERCEYKKCV